jgi:hypothetical protein
MLSHNTIDTITLLKNLSESFSSVWTLFYEWDFLDVGRAGCHVIEEHICNCTKARSVSSEILKIAVFSKRLIKIHVPGSERAQKAILKLWPSVKGYRLYLWGLDFKDREIEFRRGTA